MDTELSSHTEAVRILSLDLLNVVVVDCCGDNNMSAVYCKENLI